MICRFRNSEKSRKMSGAHTHVSFAIGLHVDKKLALTKFEPRAWCLEDMYSNVNKAILVQQYEMKKVKIGDVR